MQIYSSKDLKLINNNIEALKKKAIISQLQNIEPTFGERMKIMNIIINFIKKKKMVIYGGYAIHLYLDNSIYNTKYEIPDIDVYSIDPVNIIIELCNILKEGDPSMNIMFKEAFHKDTFSLFVNYVNYLDITYVPKNILNGLKKIKKNDFFLIHSSLIMLDIFRQFNDPLISYWRLDKNVIRYELLNKKNNFLLYFENIDNSTSLGLNYLNKDIYSKIKKYINFETMSLCGFYCYQLFTHKKFNDIYYFEIISSNYDDDVKYFNKKLTNNYKHIEKKSYSPFFQYLNKKTIFYHKNKIILIVYDTNNKCVPYIEYNNEHFISYLYFIQMTFSLYLYYTYINNEVLQKKTKKLILDCILSKNIFFEKNKDKTVLDKTIFQQFIIRCKGKTFYTNIEFLKNLQDKKKNQNQKRFNYIPNINNLIKKKIYYKYTNVDGLIIKNH